MKAWKLLMPIPIVAALAMMPQDSPTTDPSQVEVSAVQSLSELQYVSLQGTTVVVPARNFVEIRMIEDAGDRIRIELTYENGDYSLLDAQAVHLLRNGPSTREVRLVRSKQPRMRFPKLVGQ